MGMDVYAKAAIGITVKKDDLTRLKTVKTFDHSYGEEFKFDPITAKPLWKTMTVFRAELFPDFSPDCSWYLYDLTLGPYPVIAEDYNDDSELIICYAFVETESHRCGGGLNNSQALDLEGLTSKTGDLQRYIDFLKERKLWTDTFGLYAIACVSV